MVGMEHIYSPHAVVCGCLLLFLTVASTLLIFMLYFDLLYLYNLRRIFGPKENKITRVGRKLHNEELNDLYCPPTIVQVIKSRSMRCAGDVAWMGKGTGMYRILVGNVRERDHWGDPGVDGRILKWIFKK
jgi:hypothetical protein